MAVCNDFPPCTIRRSADPLPEVQRWVFQEKAQTLCRNDRVIWEMWDKETDTLSIILRPGKVAESDELRPSLILDYDKAGRLVSLELLDASEQFKAPQSIEFALSAGD
jgi:uncharacterized protein YuzE